MTNYSDILIDKESDNSEKGELIPPQKKEPVDPNKRQLLTD